MDHALAPNGERSRLYDDALSVSGDREKSLDVWATAYSDGYVRSVGNWMLNPSEYELDDNGEPRLGDVLSYIKATRFEAGEFTREETLGLSDAMVSMGLPGMTELYSAITDNFLIDGDIVLNASNMRASGLYAEDEIRRILSDAAVRDGVREMMRRIVSYGSSELDMMTPKDVRYLDPGYVGDVTVYSEGYDMLGKRRAENPMEVDDTIADIVGGIRDRAAFDEAFQRVPYPSLVERYSTDSEFAGRTFERYSAYTRIGVADRDGNILTDSTGRLTDDYLSRDRAAIDVARDRISPIIDMTDDEAADRPLMRRRLNEAALALADVGLDISEVSPTSDPESIRELMASIDALLSDLRDNPERVDTTDVTTLLDALTGKGRPLERVVRFNGKPGMMEIRVGRKDPASMYADGLLEVGRGLYRRVAPIDDVDAMYDGLADLLMVSPDSLSNADIGDVSGLEKDEVVRRIRRKVSSVSDALNDERMVLTRMALGLPLSVKRRLSDESRELARYKAANDSRMDMLSGAMRFRRLWIREKIRNSDLFRNVLRHISFGEGYTLRLDRTDPITLNRVELSLPDGLARDYLMAYAAGTSDASFRDLFHLDENVTGMDDTRFQRKYRLDNPSITRQMDGPMRRNADGTVELTGVYDNFMADGGALYEKVGETRMGSVYAFVGNMAFGDPSNISESYGGDNVSLSYHGDRDTLYPIGGASSVTVESNEYTKDNERLMRELTCG